VVDVVNSGQMTLWSHHSIRHRRKTHAARKLHSSVFYRTLVIADGSVDVAEIGNFAFFSKNIQEAH